MMSSSAQQENQLGVAAAKRGDVVSAIDHYESALRQDRTFAEAWFNLGLAQTRIGDLAAAEQSLLKTVALRNDIPQVHESLGRLVLKLHGPQQAGPHFVRTVELDPTNVVGWCQLGQARQLAGQSAAAIVAYEQALNLEPQQPEVLINLAGLYRQDQQFNKALELLQRAVRLNPKSFPAQHNLGTLCMFLGRNSQARECWRSATQLRPSDVDTLIRLGQTYLAECEWQAAEQTFLSATQHAPDDGRPFRQLGSLAKYAGDRTTASRYFQHAAAIDGSEALLDEMRDAASCEIVLESRTQGEQQLTNSIQQWRRAVTAASSSLEWGKLLYSAAEPSMHFQFRPGNPRDWMSQFAAPLADHAPRLKLLAPAKRPRVGFLVTRGHEHAFLSSLGSVLSRLSTDHKDLFVISPNSSQSAIRTQLPANIQTVDMLQDWKELSHQLRELNLDVLYFWEIGTDSVNYFLPFVRWARVQCLSFGLQFSSGIPNMDAYISSRWIEPENAGEYYSESLVLAESLLLTRPQRKSSKPNRNPDQSRIGALHQIGKFHPDWDKTLGDILRPFPQTRLLVLQDRYPYASQALADRWAQSIPDVAEQIDFLPRLTPAKFRDLLATLDFMLDPPYFGGTNTSLDALELGVPVVTYNGLDQRSRFTSACYRRMQIDGLVAKTEDEYVRLAHRLMQDEPFRDNHSARIRQANHILFDVESTVADYEDIIDQLIERARAA